MYGIDSGNGYAYGEDPTVEQIKKEQSEKEEDVETSFKDFMFSFINV